MGVRVDLNDLSIHTLMAVSDYAAKMLKNKANNNEEVEPMSMAQLRQAGITRG